MCILYYYYALKGLDHVQLACRRTTAALKVAPRDNSLASVHSLVALRESSLANVHSFVALRERSLANIFSRTFSRERSLANVSRERFLANAL